MGPCYRLRRARPYCGNRGRDRGRFVPAACFRVFVANAAWACRNHCCNALFGTALPICARVPTSGPHSPRVGRYPTNDLQGPDRSLASFSAKHPNPSFCAVLFLPNSHAFMHRDQWLLQTVADMSGPIQLDMSFEDAGQKGQNPACS